MVGATICGRFCGPGGLESLSYSWYTPRDTESRSSTDFKDYFVSTAYTHSWFFQYHYQCYISPDSSPGDKLHRHPKLGGSIINHAHTGDSKFYKSFIF